MTNTFITTNTINVGSGFTFAASGDALVVLPGVTLGSTGLFPIATGALTDLEVTILGTLVGPNMVTLNANSGFTIGLGGTMVSQQSNPGNAALFLIGGSSQATIDGTLLATEAIGILSATGGNTVTVTGSVTGGSGGVWLGLSGGLGDVLVNSGTILCGTYLDGTLINSYNNAVYSQGPNTRITNLAGGEIIGTSSEGAGVRLGAGAGGSVVHNEGTITASVWYGVDFTELGAAETAQLYNSGVIQGLAGAFNGNSTADFVTNRGTMIGQVLLGDGSDTLDGRGGSIQGQVFGGNGDDRMDFRGTGLLAGIAYGGAGLDTILGTEGQDTISGEDDVDVLDGGGGDDLLYGGGEGDSLRGGGGDDTLYGGSGTSSLNGGQGDDFILIDVDVGGPFSSLLAYGGAGGDTIYGGLEIDSIYGGDGDDIINSYDAGDLVLGGSGNDAIDLFTGDDTGRGGLGEDLILGGAGLDSLDGNDGADELRGDTENDTLNGGDGHDTLLGETHNDTLNGNSGDDLLDGGTNRDNLFGGTGGDTLVGGQSYDTLTGGQDSDVFLFALGTEIGTASGNRDIIMDFRSGEDVIDLTGIDANTLLAGNQALDFIGAAAFTSVAGQLRYSAVDGLLQGDTNGNGVADFSLELTSRPTLTGLDILL